MMTGNEVYKILKANGVNHLHHANSLLTSISLLKLQGLASRELVEASGLPQTLQYTDSSDKALGVWGDIFLDTIDIHKRASRNNQYGPVLFFVKSEILKSVGTVLITKSNPSKWNIHTPNEERYFTTLEELKQGLVIGEFGQMLTLKTPSGLLKFDDHLEYILVDDPAPNDDTNKDFKSAISAISNLTSKPIHRRECPTWCKCIANYADTQLRLKMYSSC